MAQWQVRALRAFNDNYIWALHDDSGRTVLVDPGDAAPVLHAVESSGLLPIAVLLTHHHHDHVGGVEDIRARWPVPCYAPQDPRIAGADARVGDGAVVEVPGTDLAFSVLAIPGHTASHIAFHGAGMLFCGDTLFSGGCGRLFEGTPAQMHASLARLSALPGETLVYCGHEYTLANGRFARVVEPDNAAREALLAQAQARLAKGLPSLPSSIAAERACNPFLRCDQPAVAAAVAAHSGEHGADEVQVFAGLRRWKDGFQ